MTGDVINLRLHRKAKVRSEKQQEADANRLRFGRNKSEKIREKLEKNQINAVLDGAKRDKPEPR